MQISVGQLDGVERAINTNIWLELQFGLKQSAYFFVIILKAPNPNHIGGVFVLTGVFGLIVAITNFVSEIILKVYKSHLFLLAANCQ